MLQRLADRARQPAGAGRGCRERDLLAEHGADRELVGIDVAGHAAAGIGVHRAGHHPITPERVEHGVRVGVEIEQRARALHRRAQVADVLERAARRDVPLGGGELHDPAAVGQAQAAPVDPVHDLFDARY